MSRLWLFVLTGFLLLPAQSAFAVTEQHFTFSQGQLNATWKGHGGMQAIQQADGLRLITTTPGMLTTTVDFQAEPQAAMLVTSSDKPLSIEFLWNDYANGGDTVSRLPIDIPAGSHVQTPLFLSYFNEWGRATLIGFSLPGSADLVVHNLAFASFTTAEQWQERVHSFWTFDAYRPYSINFVWGPMIADNTLLRLGMYDFLPPRAYSGTLLIYITLAVAIVISGALLLYMYGRHGVRRLWKTAFILVLCAWFVLDIRMGSQFLSWVYNDHVRYISAKPGERTLRDRKNFYDFADFVKPLVADRSSYVFFASQEWPFFGNLRYFTYPAVPSGAVDTDDTWVIFDRPDITINESGRLTMDGDELTVPGTLLGRFDERSFVFRVTSLGNNSPPSTPQ